MSSKTRSLINALRVLDSEIQSEDGVANAVVAEAATRLEEQQERIKRLEVAGQELRDLCVSRWMGDTLDQATMVCAIHRWNKAKEAKL